MKADYYRKGNQMQALNVKKHEVDICVIGGGLSGCFAAIEAARGGASALLSGIDRRIWGNDNGYYGKTNKAITYTFDKPTKVSGVRLVFDSDLDREYTDGNPDALHTSSTLFFPKSYNNTTFGFPRCLIKHYRIDVLNEMNEWNTAIEVFDNHQRFISIP
jgi:hypothetical protein